MTITGDAVGVMDMASSRLPSGIPPLGGHVGRSTLWFRHSTRSATLLSAALFSSACAPAGVAERSASVEQTIPALIPPTGDALASITADGLLRHITVLASDRYEGRAPGTRGEDSTVAYLTSRFRELGLAAGNPDGSYIQSVPMVGVTSISQLVLDVGGQRPVLRPAEDYVLWSYGPAPQIRVEPSDIIFIGYGVVAPEFDWDDFKDVDVRGKTVVFLVGDPPIPDPSDPRRLDERMFRGDAMTYYGRWTYKYEMAASRGAAAALIVHETGPAGYGWGVVASNAGRERFDIESASGTAGRVPAEGWLHLDRARWLFDAAGHDFDRLKAAALGRDFRPVSLDARASAELRNSFREVRSRNVVARVVGSDPAVRDEHIVYTAHWDHLGRDTSLRGDQIYNGAIDNASGTAWLIETAKAFMRLPRAPRRSVLFLAVTAEEYGLLGAKHYAENPLYPLERTLANINMDIINQWGRSRAIVSVGHGQSTLDEILIEEAAAQNRVVRPDPEPEKGYYYRSDHFEFAKQGVPALGFLFPGADYLDRPADFGQRKREEYVARDYHTPSDEVKPDWDLSGAAEDTRLLFRVGLRVAEGTTWPEWRPGTEFRARREEMLRQAAQRRDE